MWTTLNIAWGRHQDPGFIGSLKSFLKRKVQRLQRGSKSVGIVKYLEKWFLLNTMIASWNERLRSCGFVLKHISVDEKFENQVKIFSLRFLLQCWVNSPTFNSKVLIQNNCWGRHSLFLCVTDKRERKTQRVHWRWQKREGGGAEEPEMTGWT